MVISKETRYKNLVAKAKASYPVYDGNQELQPNELYWCKECKEINLWTYWQGRNHLDADILLVGQDWGNPWANDMESFMEKLPNVQEGPLADYMDGNGSITDAHLIKLFKEISPALDISKPCENVFFTNFVLGYRIGNISGNFKSRWARQDAKFFAELVDIIEPKVVLCLGRSVFDAVIRTYFPKKKPAIGKYNSFIESERNPITVEYASGKWMTVFALAHCGAIGTMNRNRGGQYSDRLELQKKDWKKVAEYIKNNEELKYLCR